ncbi:MAG TPA: ABC transporter permease [Yinghuangia sp.]|uniref:ABC transporter permease n=1 Tax=Yinghuangia sp. YIM S10712 TaxID=3436930 RepID=UPI002CDC4A73|nr:ABC transporter permease [Yinghuangia sp.]
MDEPVTVASTLLPVTPLLGGVVAALLLAAVTVAALAHLGHARATLVAGVRAAVQLLAVSAIITHVVDRWSATLLFLLVMCAVATTTASGRVTGGRWHLWIALPILAGTVPVLGLLLATRLVPFDGLVVIPVAGSQLGGALTATVLAGRRALEELAVRRGEVEAALALGLLARDARLEICRSAAAGALIPALDQTRTVGLVTLPGAFVGMLLGGASPVDAGAVQLFVLVALLATEAVAIAVVLELIARGLVVRPGTNSLTREAR